MSWPWPKDRNSFAIRKALQLGCGLIQPFKNSTIYLRLNKHLSTSLIRAPAVPTTRWTAAPGLRYIGILPLGSWKNVSYVKKHSLKDLSNTSVDAWMNPFVAENQKLLIKYEFRYQCICPVRVKSTEYFNRRGSIAFKNALPGLCDSYSLLFEQYNGRWPNRHIIKNLLAE